MGASALRISYSLMSIADSPKEDFFKIAIAKREMGIGLKISKMDN